MKAEFVPGNRLALLESGATYFPALRAAIDAARHELYLETYIFEDDDTGREIAAALSRAARRGVTVRLLVDGFGARDFPGRLMPALQAAGVHVLVYRPEFARFRLRRHRLRRLHRKLAVIDARVAFVGGINIIDDSNTPGQTPPRFDYAVSIEGPLLAVIHGAARQLWERVAWARFRHRLRAPVPPPSPACGCVHAALLIRDNLRHRRDIEEAYLDAILSAKDEVLLASAYFLPGRRFRHALLDAARRGVRVTLLLQGRVEYALLHHATQALYGALLAGNIRIHEYRRGFLHAKVAVIDGRWATVGSSNIDPFSLLLAREANVVVRDAGFAGELRASLQAAMADGAREQEAAEWTRKPWYRRSMNWLAYGIVRLLIGIAGYGGKH